MKLHASILFTIGGCLGLLMAPPAIALTTQEYAIELSATVQESPPRITLNWPGNSDGLQYVISRKLKGESHWTQLAVLPEYSRSYTDWNVIAGEVYEYGVTKFPEPPFDVTGYLSAAIKAPLVESRGKLLLIVDNTYASDLSAELARLQQDLVGDGWVVVRHDVSRTARPQDVRWLIQSEYYSDPGNVKSVFLFGHVPVPYSGNYDADDHPDHTGAWAADVYYADVDGTWTDSTVNRTSATRRENRNVPGDGKFDQSVLPSDVELQLGRVDLAKMPAFLPKTEKDLLRQYLDKNHNYRHGRANLPRRGIVFDGFGESGGEANAASGWRNFSPFFGSQNTTEVGWGAFFPTIQSQGYLWSYVCGGGGDRYIDCYGVGETRDFAVNNVQTIFTMLFGSYFGDWDATNDFLRAPLCSTNYALTAAWAGRPQWFFHHMALGETIGYSTRLNQNNSTLYLPNYNARQVHIALMGDPTLRMHMVVPPSNLSISGNNGLATLSWDASPEANLFGYHVYRSSWAGGPFTRISGSTPLSGTTFTDSLPDGGTFTYMVRAIKLETSASGTYMNPSQGIFSTVLIPPQSTTPVMIRDVRRVSTQITFRCEGQSGQKFAIDASTNLEHWTPLATNTLTTSSFTFSEPVGPATTTKFYRTRLAP